MQVSIRIAPTYIAVTALKLNHEVLSLQLHTLLIESGVGNHRESTHNAVASIGQVPQGRAL